METIYQINYEAYAIIIAVMIWPFVFVYLLIYDAVKRNPFRPGYRAAWPFLVMSEVLS